MRTSISRCIQQQRQHIRGAERGPVHDDVMERLVHHLYSTHRMVQVLQNQSRHSLYICSTFKEQHHRRSIPSDRDKFHTSSSTTHSLQNPHPLHNLLGTDAQPSYPTGMLPPFSSCVQPCIDVARRDENSANTIHTCGCQYCPVSVHHVVGLSARGPQSKLASVCNGWEVSRIPQYVLGVCMRGYMMVCGLVVVDGCVTWKLCSRHGKL